jgi:hypothetical protein
MVCLYQHKGREEEEIAFLEWLLEEGADLNHLDRVRVLTLVEGSASCRQLVCVCLVCATGRLHAP